jgi:hypothetical protein
MIEVTSGSVSVSVDQSRLHLIEKSESKVRHLFIEHLKNGRIEYKTIEDDLNTHKRTHTCYESSTFEELFQFVFSQSENSTQTFKLPPGLFR